MDRLDFSRFADNACRLVGLLLFGILSWLAIGNQYGGLIPWKVWLAAAIVGSAAWGMVVFGKRRIVVALVIGLALALRMAWALNVPTRPVSDFQNYHSNALALAQGEELDEPVQNPGYVFFLSLAYRCRADPIAGRLLNALAGTVTVILLYGAGSRLVGPNASLFAVLLAAVIPSEIAMTSVLCTEILSTMALVLTGAAVLRRPDFRQTFGGIALCGALSALSFSIRFQALFLIPLVLVALLKGKRSLKDLSKTVGSFALGVLVLLAALSAGYSLSLKRPYLVHFPQTSFPWLSGTNAEASGLWNPSDASLYYSFPTDQAEREVRRLAFERIRQHPGRFLRLIPRKWAWLLAENRYGGEISILEARSPWWDASAGRRELGRMAVDDFSQAIYVITLVLVFVSFRNRPIGRVQQLLLWAVALTLLPFAFLEVQPRYHHHLMPLLFLAAGSGLFGPKKLPVLHRNLAVTSTC